MRKWVLRITVLIGVGVLGLLVGLCWRSLWEAPDPGVTRENFHRLYVGMPLREVERALGGPATEAEDCAPLNVAERHVWASRTARIMVILNKPGRTVANASFDPYDPNAQAKRLNENDLTFMGRLFARLTP